MTTMTRELRGWLAVAVVVLALAAGLTVRAGLPDPDSPAAQARTRATATAVASHTEAPAAQFNPPITGVLDPPTRAAASDASPDPTETPASVAAEPTAPPTAPPPPAPPPPPAAPTPTPVPVHDDEPSLQTFERVDGAFGQSLTIGAYSVRAVRVAAPAPDACLEGNPSNVEVFDVTLTYSGPLYSVGFAIDSPSFAWCVDATGDISQQFASGVTRQVIVHTVDGDVAADAPLLVSLMPVNGPHTLLFGFH